MVSRFILDASVALSWYFEDSKSIYAEAVLRHIEESTLEVPLVIVPYIWKCEIVHALIKAKRNKRITNEKVVLSIQELDRIACDVDTTTNMRACTSIFTIANDQLLGFNDAAYIELALVEKLPIATLDRAIIRVARSFNIPLFLEQGDWKDYTTTKLVSYLKAYYNPPSLELVSGSC